MPAAGRVRLVSEGKQGGFMLGFKSTAVFGLALLACLVSGNAIQAETYVDKAHHFEIDLPKGWGPMSESELSAINGFANMRLGGAVTYLQGFRRKGTALGAFPYALVQFKEGSMNATYEEIENSITRDLPGAVKKAEGSLSDLTSNISVGSAVLDRLHDRIVIRMKLDVATIGTAQCLSVGHIGSEGIVFVHCYAQDKSFANCLRTFNDLNDGFEYDEGYNFKPGQGGSVLDGPMRHGIIGAIVALAVGGVLFGAKAVKIL
jgi:hypothetical protein